MKKFPAPYLAILALALSACAGSARAENQAATAVEAPSVASETGFDILAGRWVRPDGGYLVIIRGVDASGGLDATYQNPNPLPFAKAEASRDGTAVKVFLELRAGGYNGSTYTLTYDPANDVLHGVYYQAVARQKFDIYFERAK
jgi:hypothetical protein